MLPAPAHLWGWTAVSVPRVRAKMKCAKGVGLTWSSGAWAGLLCAGVSFGEEQRGVRGSTGRGRVQELRREAPASAAPAGTPASGALPQLRSHGSSNFPALAVNEHPRCCGGSWDVASLACAAEPEAVGVEVAVVVFGLCSEDGSVLLRSLPRDPWLRSELAACSQDGQQPSLGGPGPKPHSLCMPERFLACPWWRIQRSAGFPALGEKGDALCHACPAAFALSSAAGGRAVPDPVPCLPGGLRGCLLACQDL